jgi:hypothetical protein
MGHLLDLLVRNGYLTEEQAAEVVQSAPKPAVTVQPKSGNTLELRVRGRIQTQFGQSFAENAAGDTDQYGTFELRRIRLGVEGRVFPDVRFVVEGNFVPGNVSTQFAWLQWTRFPEANVLIGYERPLFGHEIFTSSAAILTVERSLISNRFIPSQPDTLLIPLNGVQLTGKKGRIDYGAGIYNERIDTNPVGVSSFAYSGSLGVNLDDLMPEGVEYRIRAETMQKNDPRDDIANLQPWRAPLEEAYSFSNHLKFQAFDLRAEYLLGRNFGGDRISGFYLMPSYMITPKLQAVFRYEQSRADFAQGLPAPNRYSGRVFAGDQAGDRYEAFYIGGNYYVRGNDLKLMLGVELSDLDDTKSEAAQTDAAGDVKATTVYGALRMLF